MTPLPAWLVAIMLLCAGVSDNPTRLQLSILPEGQGGPALKLEAAIAALRAGSKGEDMSDLLKVGAGCGLVCRP